MKQAIALLFAHFLAVVPSLHSQIVINEIRASNGHVEIRNNGGSTVNIGGYFLCRFPNYSQLSSLTLVCGGNLNIEADSFVTVDYNFILSADDDELALYINNSDFGNPNNIRDYVEWGFHGHTRSSVAEAAGIWTNGDFVPSWTDCVSLEYDGSGNLSGDWESQDVPTMPCIANNLNGCNLMPLELLFFQVSQIENGAGISWKAVHDATIETFFLEHSMDQKLWERMIAWQPSGPEFDRGVFNHKNIGSGIHYYRLLTRYSDGTNEPSEIRMLRMCFDDERATIWPNPSGGMIEVFVQSTDVTQAIDYLLVDTHGKVCVRENGGLHIQIDLTALPAGLYFLQIPSLGLVERVVKE